MEDEGLGEHAQKNVIEEISNLPAQTILRNVILIERFGITAAKTSFYHALIVTDLLSSAGAWENAVNVARATYAQIDDTAWNKPKKIETELVLIANECERAIWNCPGLC